MSAPRISYLVLRRMRPPLLVLVATFAISLLGLTLIPGTDPDGNPWRMDFFHAYYFLSYTATTIGYGELPYTFNDAQRAWVLVSLYMTVVAWFYGIGTILSLVQDAAFRRAAVQAHFTRNVQHIREPFYIVCGFGDTGSALVRALVARFRRVVVVDSDADVISDLRLNDYPVFVPALAADASVPLTLEQAGLGHSFCKGVVAVTPHDAINLKVAISSKLLSSRVSVYCRGENRDIEANMASFGTDYIIDPFESFSRQLSLAIRSPGVYLLHHWLNAVPHSEAEEPVYPPRGTWVLCGYGRCGKAVHRALRELGVEVIVVEAELAARKAPPGSIEGYGTEAHTLRAAGIERAGALVAGTDSDTNNLSIVMTARELNPDLFVVIRQENAENAHLYTHIEADMAMDASQIVAREIRVLLTEPLLAEFLALSHDRDNDWGTTMVSRILAVVDSEVPSVWSVTLDDHQASGVVACIEEGLAVGLRHLSIDSRSREQCLRCIPLMLKHPDHSVINPAINSPLAIGDKLLFCGDYGLARRMAWSLNDPPGFRSLVTGEAEPVTLAGRWLKKQRDEKRRQQRLDEDLESGSEAAVDSDPAPDSGQAV